VGRGAAQTFQLRHAGAAVDALEHQHRSLSRGKRGTKRLDHPQRILSLHHAVEVEDEEKDETIRRQAELSPCEFRRGSRRDQRQRYGEDRLASG
jgi:hypothetical protein